MVELAIADIELTSVLVDDRRVYLLKLEDIALSFLGLTKLPPGGGTSFYLFVDPAAGSKGGLGWYAAYNPGGRPDRVGALGEARR